MSLVYKKLESWNDINVMEEHLELVGTVVKKSPVYYSKNKQNRAYCIFYLKDNVNQLIKCICVDEIIVKKFDHIYNGCRVSIKNVTVKPLNTNYKTQSTVTYDIYIMPDTDVEIIGNFCVPDEDKLIISKISDINQYTNVYNFVGIIIDKQIIKYNNSKKCIVRVQDNTDAINIIAWNTEQFESFNIGEQMCFCDMKCVFNNDVCVVYTEDSIAYVVSKKDKHLHKYINKVGKYKNDMPLRHIDLNTFNKSFVYEGKIKCKVEYLINHKKEYLLGMGFIMGIFYSRILHNIIK